MKVAVRCPAGMVTDGGTDATFGWLLLNCTVEPPDGAGPFSVTVPVLGLLPTTGFGLKESDSMLGGSTVSVAEQSELPNRALMVTCVWLATAWVLTVKVAVRCPAGIVTDAGTDATFGWLLLSCTGKPSAGAGALIVNVPVLGLPPTTGFGLNLIEPDMGVLGREVRRLKVAMPVCPLQYARFASTMLSQAQSV